MWSTNYPRSISTSTARTNQRQAGPQMAGLYPTETISVAQRNSYNVRGLPLPQSMLIMPLYNTTRQSRPIGFLGNPSYLH